MKKMIVVTLLVVGGLAMLGTGLAAAQAPEPPTPGAGTGSGRGAGPMHFAGANDAEGLLHDYMVNAMAKALGISADEFESRRHAGETAYQIALGLGITADQIPALLGEARTAALDAAVAANAITQQQADWIKSRQAGMGLGDCAGIGQRMGGGMGGGWRWQQGNP